MQIRYVHEAYDNNRHKQIQTVGRDTTTAETNRHTQSDQHQVTEGVEHMTRAEIGESDRPTPTHRREVVGRGEDNNRHTDTDIQTNIKHQLTVGAHDNRDRHRQTHRWGEGESRQQERQTQTQRDRLSRLWGVSAQQQQRQTDTNRQTVTQWGEHTKTETDIDRLTLTHRWRGRGEAHDKERDGHRLTPNHQRGEVLDKKRDRHGHIHTNTDSTVEGRTTRTERH